MTRPPSHRTRVALLLLVALIAGAATAHSQSLVRDLTRREGEVPRRLVGYGLVVGLDGSGDRSFGGIGQSTTPTVRSVVNLLRRFNVEVPSRYLRLQNVAAVLVTAELSPYLRSGGRFEVQVAALGDATSLRGGVLWMTPLVSDPNQPPVATAQGPLYVGGDEDGRGRYTRRGNSATILEGGVLEVSLPPPAGDGLRLVLRDPDLSSASAIAGAINDAVGAGVARVEDAGAIALTPPADPNQDRNTFLASVDQVQVTVPAPARVVINSRNGTLVAGGDVRVGTAVISHGGLTLQIGDDAPTPQGTAAGLVQMASNTNVRDVAAGLHAAGARPSEIAAIFEALRSAGALSAELVIR